MLGLGSRGGEEREREEKLSLPNGVVLANEQIKQLLKLSVWGCDELYANFIIMPWRKLKQLCVVCLKDKGIICYKIRIFSLFPRLNLSSTKIFQLEFGACVLNDVSDL